MSGYESGYADGESSVEADIHVHLTEYCGKSDEDERAWPAYTLWMWREIERLRAVVDAARPICLRWETRGLGPNLPGEKPTDADLLNVLCEKVSALGGEPPQPQGYGMEEYTRGMNPEPCPTCGGIGELPEGFPSMSDRGIDCPTCGGSGDVRSCDPYGTEPDWVKCPTCGGSGRKG